MLISRPAKGSSRNLSWRANIEGTLVERSANEKMVV